MTIIYSENLPDSIRIDLIQMNSGLYSIRMVDADVEENIAIYVNFKTIEDAKQAIESKFKANK
jgi:hypothetical protein